jgi:hypothetical protein
LYALQILLSGVLVLGGTGCFSSPEGQSGRTKTQEEKGSESSSSDSGGRKAEYWFEVDVEDVHGQIIVLLNGFPVYRTGHGMKSHDHLDLPMNTALVGEANTFSLRIEPWMHRGESDLQIGSVKTTARVSLNEKKGLKGSRIHQAEIDSAYKTWSEQARRKWKQYREWEREWLQENPQAKQNITWKDGGALDSMRAWASRHPMTVSATFDNEAGPDFSRIFEEAPRLKNTPATREQLRDYAMRLRKLFAQKDTLGVYQAHRPKFQSIDFSKRKALETIGSNWFRYAWHVDFDRTDLALRRWSDGRVWEIYRDDKLSRKLSKQALFLAGQKRLQSWHKVYVAEIDGELKVVR